jgi:hypothetical protein
VGTVQGGMMILAALLVGGCAGQAPSAPSRIAIVPDATFQGDAELMDEVRSAAALWSAAGAAVEIHLSGEGIRLQSVPQAQWNSATFDVGIVDHADDDHQDVVCPGGACAFCPVGECVQMQRELLGSLSPGGRIVALAHEFGHTLGLQHVQGDPWAIMSSPLSPVLSAEGLRPADLAEYQAEH